MAIAIVLIVLVTLVVGIRIGLALGRADRTLGDLLDLDQGHSAPMPPRQRSGRTAA